MFGLFKKKLPPPDLHFAAKGYLQIAITRKHMPNANLHAIESGYAKELLDEGCSTEQALSARWGGVRAIHDEPENFDDAVEAMRETRREVGMPESMKDKAEAEKMFLAAALGVVTLASVLVPQDWPDFRKFIGA
ncbi:hypothetical protein [Sphingomonas faeni]|uniref:hypothetical protein n=1 Tax=Sphingomonas faeni TaxID=185950 RepID=UPI00334A63D4